MSRRPGDKALANNIAKRMPRYCMDALARLVRAEKPHSMSQKVTFISRLRHDKPELSSDAENIINLETQAEVAGEEKQEVVREVVEEQRVETEIEEREADQLDKGEESIDTMLDDLI